MRPGGGRTLPAYFQERERIHEKTPAGGYADSSSENGSDDGNEGGDDAADVRESAESPPRDGGDAAATARTPEEGGGADKEARATEEPEGSDGRTEAPVEGGSDGDSDGNSNVVAGNGASNQTGAADGDRTGENNGGNDGRTTQPAGEEPKMDEKEPDDSTTSPTEPQHVRKPRFDVDGDPNNEPNEPEVESGTKTTQHAATNEEPDMVEKEPTIPTTSSTELRHGSKPGDNALLPAPSSAGMSGQFGTIVLAAVIVASLSLIVLSLALLLAYRRHMRIVQTQWKGGGSFDDTIAPSSLKGSSEAPSGGASPVPNGTDIAGDSVDAGEEFNVEWDIAYQDFTAEGGGYAECADGADAPGVGAGPPSDSSQSSGRYGYSLDGMSA